MKIALLGPPGAGKSTQAQRIAETFNLVHLSSGYMLRAEKAAGTPLGRRVSQFIDHGVLVPDALLTELVQERVRAAGAGFILDGYPRTLAQAQSLDPFLHGVNLPLEMVLTFTIDNGILTRRFQGRRICPVCQAVYHLDSQPPKISDHCDIDGHQLALRPDDAPESVRKRIKTYQESVAPLMAHYAQTGILETIEASGSIDAVAALALATVRRHFQMKSSA